MLSDISPIGPSLPQPPASTPSTSPSGVQIDPNSNTALKAWDTMFQGNATAAQLTKMMVNLLNDTIQKMKSESDKAVQAIQQMKQQQEEDMNG